MTIFADPVLTLLPSAFFALLLGIAAVHKALDWSLFRQQLADYRVLPRRLEGSAAVLVPVLEAVLALAWLNGPSRQLAALGTIVLLAAYALAMAHNLRLGRDTIDCGCGGGDGSQTIRWALVWRNSGVAALAAPFLLGVVVGPRPISWIDWVSVDGGALVMMGLYLIVNQILANFPPQRALR